MRRALFMLLALPFLIITNPSNSASSVRIAVALPGPITDTGFNQFVYEGLLKARDTMGVEIAYTENVPQSAQMETLADYARRGYTVIVGAGGQYVDTAARLAKRFPNAKFVVLAGKPTPGVTTITFDTTQFGYVLGYVAGRFSKTGKLASISGEPLPVFDQLNVGLRAGFAKTHPGGVVLKTLTSDWADINKAKEASRNLIAQGADVLVAFLNGANLGVIQAAHEKGIYVMGANADFATDYPADNLVSTMLDFTAVVPWILEHVRDGTLEQRHYEFGVGTELGRLGAYNAAVPKAIRDEVDGVIKDYRGGKIKVEN